MKVAPRTKDQIALMFHFIVVLENRSVTSLGHKRVKSFLKGALIL